MAPTKKEYEKKWSQAVAKAWADKNFKEKLLKNPTQALKEMGVEIPAGRQVQVHESTDKIVHLVLPAKPHEELSEKELQSLAAGVGGPGWT